MPRQPSDLPAPRRQHSLTPDEVSIAEVIDHGLRTLEQGPAAHPMKVARYRSAQTFARQLLPFWKGMMVADFTQFNADGYRMRRSRDTKPIVAGGNGDDRATVRVGIANGTINNELNFLGYSIRHYANTHELAWPRFKIALVRDKKKLRREAEEIADRGHLARLMWAARGCTYSQPGPWNMRPMKPACFTPAPPRHAGRIRTGRRHMLRVMLLVYYTGSTLNCVYRLRWKGDPEGDESYVDLEKRVLYRLGTDAAAGKSAGMPVPICARLLQHLKRWHRIDAAAGCETIVHLNDGKEMRSPKGVAFPKIRADAGFSRSTKLIDIRWLTGRELMEKKVTARSASLFMGMAFGDFVARFKRHREDFMEAVVLALQGRPPSVQSLSKLSSEWRVG